jgi:hypothetical protein
MFIFRFRKSLKNPEQAETESAKLAPQKKWRRRFQQFKNICKNVITFLFSRVGLVFAVIGYIGLGGVIFQSIEGTHEQEKAKNSTKSFNIINMRTENLVNEIWNMTRYELIFHKRNYTRKIKEKILDYQMAVIANKETASGGPAPAKWTFTGSLVYAVTIVTSIGYGHIYCETDSGKIATMFYAILGIPLMLVMQFNIGSSMANLFRFIYLKVCCGYCNYVKKRHIRKNTAALSAIAAKHATATLVKETTKPPEILSKEEAATAAVAAAEIDQLFKEKEAQDKNSISKNGGVIVQAPNEAQIMDLFDTESTSVDYRKVTVPISITLFVIVSYVFLGGYLFKTLEGWTLLDGIYFCLITLLTIGLGDFVPGNSISVENSNEYVLAIVAFYILMGISLLSMCINLMQEEVLAKIKKLGVRLGIVEDPNYW